MKIRFTAEIIDDNGNVLKNPVSVETKVPDLTDFNCPSEFLKVFDRYERPVIEARNQIASEKGANSYSLPTRNIYDRWFGHELP